MDKVVRLQPPGLPPRPPRLPPRRTAHFVRDGDRLLKQIVQWLVDLCLERRNLYVSTARMRVWERSLQNFLATQERLAQVQMEPPLLWRLFRVVRWYRDHYDDDRYIPVVESARALIEKFGRLESAMKRRT